MVGPAQQARIDAFVAGAADALALFDAWADPVIAHRAWRLGDQREDLRQEVRLRLLRGFREGRVPRDGALRGYVQRVAQHVCIDAVRRARVRRAEELSEELPAPSCDGPDAELDRLESARLCRAVLDRLTPRCRELFRLVLLEELSYRQIAERLAVELGTVRSRLARCRDRAEVLRQSLRGERS